MNKQDALNNLYNYREKIEDALAEIEAIIQAYFPEEYDLCYQHWIPQIKTALRKNTKWLPRGEYSMDYTLNHILDKLVEDENKGVTKYIK